MCVCVYLPSRHQCIQQSRNVQGLCKVARTQGAGRAGATDECSRMITNIVKQIHLTSAQYRVLGFEFKATFGVQGFGHTADEKHPALP